MRGRVVGTWLRVGKRVRRVVGMLEREGSCRMLLGKAVVDAVAFPVSTVLLERGEAVNGGWPTDEVLAEVTLMDGVSTERDG